MFGISIQLQNSNLKLSEINIAKIHIWYKLRWTIDCQFSDIILLPLTFCNLKSEKILKIILYLNSNCKPVENNLYASDWKGCPSLTLFLIYVALLNSL